MIPQILIPFPDISPLFPVASHHLPQPALTHTRELFQLDGTQILPLDDRSMLIAVWILICIVATLFYIRHPGARDYVAYS